MAGLHFVRFHQPPLGPNFEDTPTHARYPQFRFIFVKKGANGVEMITWSHFLLLSFVKKVKFKKKKS